MRRCYTPRMRLTQEPHEGSYAMAGRSNDLRGARRGMEVSGFTRDSIEPVRDFTARKTLEQAHAFVTGLASVLRGAEERESDRALLRELAAAGITADDADEVARAALSLVDLMADRDRMAELYQAAVRDAVLGERAMYERLAELAHVLRARLGSRSPALSRFGVPAETDPRSRAKPLGRALASPGSVK